MRSLSFSPVGPGHRRWTGGNPGADDRDLIATAIRWTRSLCGIDLSRCKRWIKFAQFNYELDGGRALTSVVFLPDVWNALPTQQEYNATRTMFLQKCVAKQEHDATVAVYDKEATVAAAGKLKVSELRAELGKRNISTKNMKKKADLYTALVAAIHRGGDSGACSKNKHSRGNHPVMPTPDVPEECCLLVLCPDAYATKAHGGSLANTSERFSTLLAHTAIKEDDGEGKGAKRKGGAKARAKKKRRKVVTVVQTTTANAEFEMSTTLRMFDDMLQRRFAAQLFQKMCWKQVASSYRSPSSPSSPTTGQEGRGDLPEDYYETVASFRYFDAAADMKIDRTTLARAIRNLGRGVSRRQLERLLGLAAKEGEEEEEDKEPSSAQRVAYTSLLG